MLSIISVCFRSFFFFLFFFLLEQPIASIMVCSIFPSCIIYSDSSKVQHIHSSYKLHIISGYKNHKNLNYVRRLKASSSISLEIEIQFRGIKKFQNQKTRQRVYINNNDSQMIYNSTRTRHVVCEFGLQLYCAHKLKEMPMLRIQCLCIMFS